MAYAQAATAELKLSHLHRLNAPQLYTHNMAAATLNIDNTCK